MKAGLLAVAAFSAVAFAQPHRRHVALHEREAAVETQWFTQVDVVTATAPAAVVYVDQNGQPIAGPTNAPIVNAKFGGGSQGDHQGQDQHGHGPASAPTTTAVVAPAPAQNTPAPVISIPAPVVPVVSIPAVVVPSIVASPSPAPADSGSSSSDSGLGITYSPYTTAGGPCRSADQVAGEIKALSSYSTIRLYGTDCDQITNVMAAISPNQKVLLGIFFIDGTLDAEISSLKSQVNGRWGQVEAVTVGNELVQQGTGADVVLAAVSKVRSALAGTYTGTVTTVDTVAAVLGNPALCGAGDSGSTKATVYVNSHAFFDPNTKADGAGPFVKSQVGQVKDKCPGRDVIVAESGWPRASGLDMTNGAAIPGVSQQAAAIKSLKDSFSSGLFLFSAHNEAWKPNLPGTFGVEQHWGLVDSN